MKKTIAFIVCLALAVSSIFISAQHNKALTPSITTFEGAVKGLIAGVTSSPTPTVTADANPAIVAKEGVYDYYILTGNVTVTSLDQLAEVQAALDVGGTFDGQGFTLTTKINGPMFPTLRAGVIKNLVVDGDITGTSVEHGVFAANVIESGVTFDTVLVKATLRRGGSTGGFVGQIKAPMTFRNCEFAGTITTTSSSVGGYAGGFAVFNDGRVTFENCTSSGTVNFGANIGGFLGAARGGSVIITNCESTATLDAANNCTPNGDASANGSGGFIGKINDIYYLKNVKIFDSVSKATFIAGGTVARSHGGFVGTVLRTGYEIEYYTSGLYINNCVSDCKFDMTDTYSGEGHFGGFVGRISRNYAGKNRSVVIVDCVNNTKVDLNKPNATAFIHLGGFIGTYEAPNDYETYVKLLNCENNGDISLKIKRRAHLGGFVGYFTNWATKAKLDAENCVNNGDITYTEVSGAADDGGRIAGGFLGLSNHCGVFNINNFTNNGNITVTTTSTKTSDVVAGGVIGFWGTAGADILTLTGSVNNGTVTAAAGTGATTARIRAGGAVGFGKFSKVTVEGFLNNGEVKAYCANSSANGTAYAAGIVGNPVSGTVEVKNSINLKKITVDYPATSAAYSINATGTATNCVDCSTISNTSFTADATMTSGACVTEVSKEFYDKIASSATNVEFGAIITLKDYIDIIGEFTHENFDAYYATNKSAIDEKAGKELGRLYEIATFKYGETLADAEIEGGSYVVNVKLIGADDYAYVARTFIKIGSLYIYSK